MSYWKHDLLPAHVQHLLIDAGKAERTDLIDRAIERAKQLAPHRFYKENDKLLENRVFYDQPAERVPMAGFMVPRRGNV